MKNTKIALVTGANRGIGLETARQLASLGMKVIAAARTEEKASSAAETLTSQGLDAEPLVIDLIQPESAAAEVSRRFSGLDVLVNNAGVLLDDESLSASGQSLDTWRETFETNFFGLIATTRAFLPLLLASDAGRIVNLSSILGSLTLQSDPESPIYGSKATSYNVSKTAVNAWTVQLAQELRHTSVKVNACHPGWVKTSMGGEEAPMEIVDGAKSSVILATLPDDGPNGGYFHMGEPIPW